MDINYKGIILSSEYTDEDEAMSFVENGLEYSCDGLRLLKSSVVNCPNEIQIREGVMVICDKAFEGCMASKILMPKSLVLIGECTFGNSNLCSVIVPNNVLRIGAKAFQYCESLTQVSLGSQLTVIESKAFYECSSLGTIKFPNTIKEIGDAAFYGCIKLQHVDLGKVNRIKELTFYGTKIRKITLPESVSHVSSRAFEGCIYLKQVLIENPKSIEIEKNAFKGCYSIETSCKVNLSNMFGSEIFGEVEVVGSKITKATKAIKDYWEAISTPSGEDFNYPLDDLNYI